MTFRMPSPPPGACLVADEDGRGWPLLRWRQPVGGAERLRAAAVFGLWLCLWIVGGLGVGPYVLGDVLDGSKPWDRRIGGVIWLAFWPVGFMVGAGPLWRALRGPLPETLLFEPEFLCYSADGPVRFENQEAARTARMPPWPRRCVETISRGAIADVRLERHGGRQHLILCDGPAVLEIGRGLREPEQEWLARVLLAWAGRPEASDVPSPRPTLSSPP